MWIASETLEEKMKDGIEEILQTRNRENLEAKEEKEKEIEERKKRIRVYLV